MRARQRRYFEALGEAELRRLAAAAAADPARLGEAGAGPGALAALAELLVDAPVPRAHLDALPPPDDAGPAAERAAASPAAAEGEGGEEGPGQVSMPYVA